MAVSNPIARLSPDQREGQYLAIAKWYGRKMEMSHVGITQWSSALRLANGVVITYKVCFWLKEIFISVPPPPIEKVLESTVENLVIAFSAYYENKDSIFRKGSILLPVKNNKITQFNNDTVVDLIVEFLPNQQYWYDGRSTYIRYSCIHRYEFTDSMEFTAQNAYTGNGYATSFTVITAAKDSVETVVPTEKVVRSACKFKHPTKTIYIFTTAEFAGVYLVTKIYYSVEDSGWIELADTDDIPFAAKLFFNEDGDIGYGVSAGLYTVAFVYTEPIDPNDPEDYGELNYTIATTETEIINTETPAPPLSTTPYQSPFDGGYFTAYTKELYRVDVVGNNLIKIYVETTSDKYWTGDWYGNVGRGFAGHSESNLLIGSTTLPYKKTFRVPYIGFLDAEEPHPYPDGSYSESLHSINYQYLMLDFRTPLVGYGIFEYSTMFITNITISGGYIVASSASYENYMNFSNEGVILKEERNTISIPVQLYKDYNIDLVDGMFESKYAIGTESIPVLRLVVPGAFPEDSRVFVSWANAPLGEVQFNYYSNKSLISNIIPDSEDDKKDKLLDRLVYSAGLTI